MDPVTTRHLLVILPNLDDRRRFFEWLDPIWTPYMYRMMNDIDLAQHLYGDPAQWHTYTQILIVNFCEWAIARWLEYCEDFPEE